jgi:WS/DGAT/MGAT family acyltransferase
MSSKQEVAARVPLASVDRTWWRMDDPTNLMIINGVLALDRPLSVPELKEVFERRILPIRRFRQRLSFPVGGGRPSWEDDPAFDLDAHLAAEDLPGAGGDVELADRVSRWMSEPLDPARPLWKFHLVGNYHGGTAIVGRLHHCIGDGMALLLVLLALTDTAADAALSDDPHGHPFTNVFHDHQANFAEVRRLAEEVMPDGIRLMLQPADALKTASPFLTGLAVVPTLAVLVGRSPDPKTVYKGKLGVAKRVAWSASVPVEDVKTVGRALGCTVNDVLLTAMAGGLRRYLAAHGGVPGPLNFRAAMPVNLRPLERMADLGNQFGLVFLSLPVGIEDPVERLAELKRRSAKLKRSAEPVVVLGILKAMGALPMWVHRLVVKIFAAKTTAVMTNVPGPRQRLYLAGREIRDVFFWVPQSGRVGLGISIFSYAGQVRLGVGTDAGLVPDPQVLVDGFHDEFQALYRRVAGIP